MIKRYKIKSLVWAVQDETSVKFHVQSDDYFGTIATVLRLLKQQIKEDSRADEAVLEKTLQNLESDLLFLQTHYRIRPKTQSKPKIKNKKISPKGRLRSQ